MDQSVGKWAVSYKGNYLPRNKVFVPEFFLCTKIKVLDLRRPIIKLSHCLFSFIMKTEDEKLAAIERTLNQVWCTDL